MKRCALFLMVGLIAVGMNITASHVAARPEYKVRLDEATKTAKAADAIKEAKCNTCHFGKTKKNRNEFGQALNKHINDEVYKSLKVNKDNLNKKVDEALKSVMKEMSKQGKSFGALIDSGALPAVNPED